MAVENRIDGGAIVVSAVCVVHCLGLPLLLTLAPLMSLGWLSPEHFHWAMLLIAVPLSALGLWQGFRRHAQWMVPILGALGLGLMAYDLLPQHDDHTHGLTLFGVILVALAHTLNIRGIRRGVPCH
ncbi:MAG: MerC domain-containing protein [Gammaproteobacteria bacterium]|nr:MAG: MerC domain-containing protein [Gammaproteobacteria bacterium]